MAQEIEIVNPKISMRDVYMRFWDCRDFEISHVWQRAIFLTAFLIACFAGYGGLLVAVFSPGYHTISYEISNGLGFVISCIGQIVSLLWIMMAKGSKMWYENYEAAIEAISDNYKDAFDNDSVASIGGMYLQNIKGYDESEKSDWLWSTKGGRYSVSRINIFIGQLSFVAWVIVGVAHILIAQTGCKSLRTIRLLKMTMTEPLVMIGIGVGLLLMFWLCARFFLKSRARGD